MSTKTIVVAILWLAAVLIFFVIGLEVWKPTKYNWTDVALGLGFLGFLVQLVWQA